MTKKMKMVSLVLAAMLVLGTGMALPVAAAAEPAVVNAGFEEVENGKAVGWSFTAGAETVVGDTDGAYSGNYVKLIGSDQSVTGTTVTGLTAGETYALSFAIKSQDQNIAMLGLEQRNAAKDESMSSVTSSNWPVTDGAWRKVSYTFTLVDGADAVRIILRTLTADYYPSTAEAGAFVCYDAVSLESLGDERVVNGSMEAVTGSVPDNWTVSDSEKVTADKNADAGTYSMKLTGADAGTVVRAYQAVNAPYANQNANFTGAAYRLSARICIPAELTGAFKILVYRDKLTATYPTGYIGGSTGMKTATGGFVTFSTVLGRGNGAFTKALVALELDGEGVVYVDNVSLIPLTEGLLFNGGFEEYKTDIAGGQSVGGDWTMLNTVGHSWEIVRDAEAAYEGEAYLKFTATDGTYPYARAAVSGLPTAAGVYRVDFMFKSDDEAVGPMCHGERGGSQVNCLLTDYTGTYGEWTRCTSWIQKPEGDNYLNIRFATDSNTVRYIDDVRVSLDETRLSFLDTKRTETADMEAAEKVTLRYVSETEVTDTPNLMVAAYKTVSGEKMLCGFGIAAAPTKKILTVGEKSWYTYTYTCDVPTAEVAEYLEAFAWDGVTPLTDKEVAR